jgi:hypothetical protein
MKGKKGNGRDVSNIGLTGIQSIRIGGMTMDTMPMREAALTKQQWPDIEEAARTQEIANIKAEYPTQRISYLKSRVVEAECNIKRIRGLINDQNTMINEYSTHIGLCEFRDKEISRLDPDEDSDQIQTLKKQFPPYNVDAMKQQIEQCREAITLSDRVVDEEHKSIAELKDTITLCRLRDDKLKKYGAEIG